MPTWVWIIIAVLMFGFAGLFIFFRVAVVASNTARSEILQRGDVVKAWIVHVIPAEGLMWDIVLILFSPDDRADDEFMRSLVRRVKKIRKSRNRDLERDEARVAKLTGREADSEGRALLPKRFTDGIEVYSFFFNIGGEDLDNLPEGGLDNAWFRIRLLWDEFENYLITEPPRSRKPRRLRDE